VRDTGGNDLGWALERAATLLISSRYTIAMTGAGVSVESGIPPFRGPGGLWTKYGEPPLDAYQRFLADPKGYWEERLQAPSAIVQALAQARPNAGHEAMAELERIGILRHLITQNIDNLHRAAGHQKLAEIHGNAQLLRCIQCGQRFAQDAIAIAIDELPPHCPSCTASSKPIPCTSANPFRRKCWKSASPRHARRTACWWLGRRPWSIRPPPCRRW